jgi:magnesium transporter
MRSQASKEDIQSAGELIASIGRQTDGEEIALRDFEHAIVEDGRDHGSIRASFRRPTLDGTTEIPPSELQRLLRRPASRRARPSSKTSRSSSPPNSVDAFADPRRRERANTLESRAPSDLDLHLHRTLSRGTQPRRPTFGEEQGNSAETILTPGLDRQAAEADVCFPPPVVEEASIEHVIDFEVLEEYASRCRANHQQPVGGTVSGQINESHLSLYMNGLCDGIGKRHLSATPTDSKPNEDLGEDDSRDSGAVDKQADAYSLKRRPSAASAAPVVDTNRFSFFTSELDSTIHAAELSDLTMPGESFRELFELNPAGGVWWLDVVNPTEEEVTTLGRAFSIHPLTTEDISIQETREKVELFKQYYFVCFRSFFQADKDSENYMEPLNVYIVVFRKGVLSFTFSPSVHAANVRRRIGKLRDYVSLSSDWVCYALL